MADASDYIDDDGIWNDGLEDTGTDPSSPSDDAEAAAEQQPRDYVDKNGTWVGSGVNQTEDHRARIEARAERRDKHLQEMQRTVLLRLGWLILIVFLAILGTVAAKVIETEFAKELLQVVMAPLLAAAAVVVGYFFGKSS